MTDKSPNPVPQASEEANSIQVVAGSFKPTRDYLGELINRAWLVWARGHPRSDESWLVPFAEQDEKYKEVDRQLGEAVWAECEKRNCEPLRSALSEAQERAATESRKAFEFAEAILSAFNPNEHGWIHPYTRDGKDAADYLKSAGYLGRHHEKDWYYWIREKK